jgi:PPK2 family polyphosphate:nucleotide phosphotransferase
MSQHLTPPPNSEVKLKDFAPDHIWDNWTKESAESRLDENTPVIDSLAHRLYAENQRSVLLILQGMDTSGKDGTIRRVTIGVNPVSFQIVAFKQPSPEELSHDFLWRIHRHVPSHGQIGIFNRSHYEDVLIVRVHELVPKSVWKKRYEQINAFEELLVENNVTLLKCFLHISKQEQKERLEARLRDATKRWKFSRGDLAERKRWDDYQHAYEDLLQRCNTRHAPWHIIPANRKWYRNLLISNLLRDTLEKMDPKYPPEEPGLEDVVIE